MLLGLHLNNYGVLHDIQLGLDLQHLLLTEDGNAESLPGALQPLTALIGRNSTGKSSLFDALTFLSDCLHHGVPYAATQRDRGGFNHLLTAGAPASMRFNLLLRLEKQAFYLNYQIEMNCDQQGRPGVNFEQVVKVSYTSAQGWQQFVLLELENGNGFVIDEGQKRPAGVADLKNPALSAYGSLTAYPELQDLANHLEHWFLCQPGQTAAGSKPMNERYGHRHLNESCDNIRNVLTYYRTEQGDEFSHMMSRITDKMPNGKRVDKAFLDGDMTSGNLRLFSFLLLLADPRPRPLICLEEPESGLYHDMVEALSFEMRDYTLRQPGCQILFTTHSPYVLETMRPDEVWVFERREDAGELAPGLLFAQARCVGEDPLVKAMYRQGVGMGALWYGGHFDTRNEPPEQGDL